MKNGRKGFTLVELAIVLVIVGLLIGGILVAQSMIGTSRIVAQVAQIEQFDAGVMNFRTKYNYLPGDAPAFGGDGDGAIDCANNSHQIGVFDIEHATFWNNFDHNLYTQNSTNGGFGVKADYGEASKNVPLSEFGKPNSFVITSGSWEGGPDSMADLVNLQNFYVILDGSQAQTNGNGYFHFDATTINNSAVSAAELLALDTKFDDGIADSGYVVAGKMTSCGFAGAACIDPNPLAECASSATYTISNPHYTCTPLIRIGAQAGDPQ